MGQHVTADSQITALIVVADSLREIPAKRMAKTSNRIAGRMRSHNPEFTLFKMAQSRNLWMFLVTLEGPLAEKFVFVYRIESPVKSKYFHKIVDKSCGFGYLKLDEWERV